MQATGETILLLGCLACVLFEVYMFVDMARFNRRRQERMARREAERAAYDEMMDAGDRRDAEGVRRAYKRWCELSRR